MVETSDGDSINGAGPGSTGERWVDCSLTSWHGHSSWREQTLGQGTIFDVQGKKILRGRPGECEDTVSSSLP